MGLLFIYQIGGRDLEVTVELSNSFSLSSSLTWSIWSKVTLGITYLWMWELVNHFIIFRSRQADQDHRPLCACKASHSSEFSSGISAEIIQCVCVRKYTAESMNLLLYANTAKWQVQFLDSTSIKISSALEHIPQQHPAGPLPSTQRKALWGLQSENVPWLESTALLT